MPFAQPRILVPLQDPADEADVVRLAASLVSGPWGELHLVHVLTTHSPPAAEVEAQLQQLTRVALDMGVGAIAHLDAGPDVAAAIGTALTRWNCSTMVIGWTGKVQPEAIRAATNRAVTKAGDVDTLIFKNRGFGRARRICVPTSGGSHAMVGIQVAADLAARWDSELRVVRIARDPHRRQGDPVLERYCRQLEADTLLQLRMLGVQAPVQIVPDPQIVTRVVELTRACDLVVLGASNDWRLDQYLAGSIPDQIASQLTCSVLMVRAGGAEKLALSRIFYENTIRLNLHPVDKWDAIDKLVDVLVEEQQIPASQREPVRAAAIEREGVTPTAMGHHTAIPHAPIADLPGILGAMAICPDGVAFGGPDAELARFIFLLLTPRHNYGNYVPVLARIAALIRRPANQAALLACQTPSEVAELLRRTASR
jgi:fructose PTS system EIIA component